ncbi:hypothetical protein Tco_1345090 [Tanacetum coccineum]
MRNKESIDELDIDDLYNNLKVFEADIKGSSGSSLNSQNVAFLSAEDTNSINEVNTANGVSTVAGHSSQGQASSSSYTNDLMFSFFADQIEMQDNALIVQDGLGYDWSYIAQDEPTEFALMAYTSNSSGSDTETSASVSQVETSNTPPSNTSVEMPRVESVRPSGVIIEDWVSDDEDHIFQSKDS